MKSKVVKFPGVNNKEDRDLRMVPFNESYLMHAVIDDLILDYARTIVNVFNDIAKGEADPEQLHRILLRAQYACYLRGIYDERKGEDVLEVPGMPERPIRIELEQKRRASR